MEVYDMTREKIVLIIAEAQYQRRNDGKELDSADADIKAEEILYADHTVDALVRAALIKV